MTRDEWVANAIAGPLTSNRSIVKSDAYWAHIRAHVATAPPLTASQRDIIRRAFRPVLDAMAAERQIGR
jgi:hypothetical protein